MSSDDDVEFEGSDEDSESESNEDLTDSDSDSGSDDDDNDDDGEPESHAYDINDPRTRQHQAYKISHEQAVATRERYEQSDDPEERLANVEAARNHIFEYVCRLVDLWTKQLT